MKNNILVLVIFGLLAILAVGCGSTPTPTPMPTQAPVQITVVVTATLPPPTATSPLPTLTPIPTVALTTTAATATPLTVAQATKASSSSAAPKATATKKPGTVVPLATATATAIPLKYAAPNILSPQFNDTQKDERHFPGDAILFRWASLGGLNGDECYLIDASFEPGQRDQFLTGCGNATAIGYPVEFRLNQPNQAGPNYSALLPINGSQELWVYWTVTIVKNLGVKADKVHYNTAPLSPSSARVKFLLKGS